MLKTLISCQEEQNRNSERKKTNSNASSKQSNEKNLSKSADYEDEQNCQRNSKEVLNRRKNDSTPNSERSKARQNKSPSHDSERKLVWINNKNYSSRKSLSPQSLNDKKDLVFDKRDFIFRDIPKKIREQIQLDEVAKYSTTDTRTADEISNFIANLDGLNADNIVITDGTACVGGNTISFCKQFKKVQAVELDRNRYDMLKHNLKILGHTNATCYHADYLELLCNLSQDIVFLDPPWGGPSYKEKDEVELFIGNVPLDEICEKLKRRTKYIIIKAPTNLNYEKFKANISGNLQVLHKFRKMLLIVVDYYHSPEVIQREPIPNDCNQDYDKIYVNGNGNRNKETNKSHNTDTKDQKTTYNSAYVAAAVAAVKYAAAYYRDYECGRYACERAYTAALAAARDGPEAARSAATAAYYNANLDVKWSHNYDDPRAADDFLKFASTYDYFGSDDTDDANDDNVTDGIYRIGLDADGTESTGGTNGADGTESTNDTDGTNGTYRIDLDTDGTNDTYRIDLDTDGTNDTYRIDLDTDGTNGASGTDGANGTYHTDLEAAANATLDTDDF